MTRAVLDAGPLIHLAELESLDILSDFQILYVANTVWQEAEQHQVADIGLSDSERSQP